MLIEADAVVVESFSAQPIVTLDVGQTYNVHCGLFRNRLLINENLVVRGDCVAQSAFGYALAVSGVFPRLVISRVGRPGAETLDLREVLQ